jgi:hypothetical protein
MDLGPWLMISACRRIIGTPAQPGKLLTFLLDTLEHWMLLRRASVGLCGSESR